MDAVIKTRLVRIGNSQGIRIPKLVLEQLNLATEVELEVQQDQLIVRSPAQRRQGWEQKFQAMAAQADDQLLIDEVISPSWDAEWEWT